MFLKVLQGKVNYEGKIFKTEEMFECDEVLGKRLINSSICQEIPKDLYSALNNLKDQNREDIKPLENDSKKNKSSKTIDDLRKDIE